MYQENEIYKKVNDIIKRKQSQWKYNGCSMSKTSIMENILKDLFFKNKTMFKYINNKTYYYRNYFVDNTFVSIVKKLGIDIDENKREITF